MNDSLLQRVQAAKELADRAEREGREPWIATYAMQAASREFAKLITDLAAEVEKLEAERERLSDALELLRWMFLDRRPTLRLDEAALRVMEKVDGALHAVNKLVGP